MPSEEVFDRIQESLADGESAEDFGMLVDLLTNQRAPFHPEAERAEVELISGFIACIRDPVKPDSYRETMAEFRLLFQGVAEDHFLQLLFTASIFPAALAISSKQQLIFMPSNYFNPLPILGAHGIAGDSEALNERYPEFFIDHARMAMS